MAYGIRFIGSLITIYLFYVWTFLCPLTTIDNEINSLSPVNHHFCSLSNNYIKPHVQPIYEQHIAPLWISVDEKLGLVQKYDQSIVYAHLVDEKFGIKEAIGKFSESACDHLQKLIDYFQDNITPKLIRTLKLFILKTKFYWEIFKINSQFYSTPIVNQLYKVGHSIRSIEFIGKIIDFLNDIYVKLATSKHGLKFQEKSKFVQQEFKNLVNIDDFSASEIKNNVIQIVKDILGENVFEPKKVKDSVEVEEEIEEEIADLDDDDDLYAEDYDDEEPETIVITSTIVVTGTDGSNAVSTDDPVLGPILHEINYWENKVNKSISSAMNNLKAEMKPEIESVIAIIKPEISQILQDVQKLNAEQYAKMNRKISAITRDFEEMKETNDTSLETVNRQEIRDDISECSQSAQQSSQTIQEILTKNHEDVLVSYFKVLQDTIDILETTSEGTINSFQNQLNNLINQLDLDDDEDINWKIWKKFHKIKESLFDFRDFLFDSANDYKINNKGKSVVGLEEWNSYLQNIEAHLNFLIRDNFEYLQIIRARANIAFQLREGLVYELNKIEEEKNQKEEEQQVAEEEESAGEESIEEPIEEIVIEEEVEIEEPEVEYESIVNESIVEEPSIDIDIESNDDYIENSDSIDEDYSDESPIESVEAKSETTPDFESTSESIVISEKSNTPEYDQDEQEEEQDDDDDEDELIFEVYEEYDEIKVEDEPIEGEQVEDMPIKNEFIEDKSKDKI